MIRQRERRRSRMAGSVVAMLVLSLVVASVVGLVFAWRWIFGGGGGDFDENQAQQEKVVFEIVPGSSVTMIGRTLTDKGIIASPDAFIEAVKSDLTGPKVQPGWYRLPKGMMARDALVALLDPVNRADIKVTIPEGLRLTEIIKRLSSALGIPEDKLLAAVNSGDNGLPPYAQGKPEGYLYPTTYMFPPTQDATQIIAAMTAQFTTVSLTLDIDQLKPRYPENQVVIIASLVQAEAKRPEDFPKVARVIYNRLDKNMPLQFDSTVNYAMKDNKVTISTNDIQFDSPYNTYKNRGLPPGPINSPGERALSAALSPAAGNWLYFVATDEQAGITEFADTYQQFLTLKKKMKDTRAIQQPTAKPAG